MRLRPRPARRRTRRAAAGGLAAVAALVALAALATLGPGRAEADTGLPPVEGVVDGVVDAVGGDLLDDPTAPVTTLPLLRDAPVPEVPDPGALLVAPEVPGGEITPELPDLGDVVPGDDPVPSLTGGQVDASSTTADRSGGAGGAGRSAGTSGRADDGDAGPDAGAGSDRDVTSGGTPGLDRVGTVATSAPRGLAAATLAAARSFSFPLAVAAAIALFLCVQSRLDSRDPKLARAPVDDRDDFRGFS